MSPPPSLKTAYHNWAEQIFLLHTGTHKATGADGQKKNCQESTCYNCNKRGHWAWECRSKPIHVIQTENMLTRPPEDAEAAINAVNT